MCISQITSQEACLVPDFHAYWLTLHLLCKQPADTLWPTYETFYSSSYHIWFLAPIHREILFQIILFWLLLGFSFPWRVRISAECLTQYMLWKFQDKNFQLYKVIHIILWHASMIIRHFLNWDSFTWSYKWFLLPVPLWLNI